MYSSQTRSSQANPGPALPLIAELSWQQGSFVPDSLIAAADYASIGPFEPICNTGRCETPTSISPLSLNLHVSPDCETVPNASLLNALLIDLRASLSQWKYRPLSELYWNRQLIEQLDEGSLTELAFHCANKLKQTNKPYTHTAELSTKAVCLSKLALLRGLGVNRILFYLPISPLDMSASMRSLIQAAQQAKDLGHQIGVRLTYDIDQTTDLELVRLLLDMPLLGPHELLLAPLKYSGSDYHSSWVSYKLTDNTVFNLSRVRNLLISLGYRSIGFDQFSFGELNPPSNCSCHQEIHFSPLGCLNAISSDFVGIGPGARTRVGAFAATNQSHFDLYLQLLTQGQYPRKSCRKFSQRLIQTESLIVDLLTHLQMDLITANTWLGKSTVEALKFQLSQVPSELWDWDPGRFLILHEKSRDWLPVICSWLIENGAIGEFS